VRDAAEHEQPEPPRPRERAIRGARELEGRKAGDEHPEGEGELGLGLQVEQGETHGGADPDGQRDVDEQHPPGHGAKAAGQEPGRQREVERYERGEQRLDRTNWAPMLAAITVPPKPIAPSVVNAIRAIAASATRVPVIQA